MLSITVTEHPLEHSKRIRHLDEWVIVPAIHEGVVEYHLEGFVIKALGEELPDARLTATSPMVSCIGNKVTTMSGSVYFLGEPNPIWIQNSPAIGELDLIPEMYLNKHLR